MSKEKHLYEGFILPLNRDSKNKMSTRLVIATKILAGLVGTELTGIGLAKTKERIPKIVEIALSYTDELLKQENNGI